MSNYRIGIGEVGYIGSPDLQTSEANQEVIPNGKTCYKFSFVNHNTCLFNVIRWF